VAVTCRDLFAEQVAVEMGVSPADSGRIVAHTVVADGEAGDGVDMSLGERARERLGIEIVPHAGDQGRGVEIEMHLAKPKVGYWRRNVILCKHGENAPSIGAIILRRSALSSRAPGSAGNHRRSTISMLPGILLVILLRRYLAEGISISGLGGH
jgi:hypothetical protein